MQWLMRQLRKPPRLTNRESSAASDVFVIENARSALASLRAALQRPTFFLTASLQSHSKPWGAWTVAVILTVGIHCLLVGSLVLGTGPVKTRPMTEGLHAVEKNANGTEFVSTLILLNDTSIHSANDDTNSAYIAQQESEPTLKDTLIASTGIGEPTLPMLDDSTETATTVNEEQAGDGAEIARLFGVYMGQIKARIERAWSFPAMVKTQTFRCKAQIRQSQKGEVQEITLQQCDLQGEWQASLIKAIQSASPLSAPPSEKVFTDVITLSFSADARATSERIAAITSNHASALKTSLAPASTLVHAFTAPKAQIQN